MSKETPKQTDAPKSMTMASGLKDQETEIAQPEESEYKGAWRNKKDGYLYKHCVKPHALGKTHKAIVPPQYEDRDDGSGKKVKTLVHTGLFWEGFPEEFSTQFEKE